MDSEKAGWSPDRLIGLSKTVPIPFLMYLQLLPSFPAREQQHQLTK